MNNKNSFSNICRLLSKYKNSEKELNISVETRRQVSITQDTSTRLLLTILVTNENLKMDRTKGIETLLEKSGQVAQTLSEQAMMFLATTIKTDQQKLPQLVAIDIKFLLENPYLVQQ
ncbi:hypothetical protein F8M41_007756 [Gigaspora margarita]|uniref:Uncharacterized protein n=1 Tax=Gigaspora margarita TaxID=4874 RepID=A0A8H3X4G2_GIGMA|nr:hypothetical protein F8M41_007756 [Gigaspora margarita]